MKEKLKAYMELNEMPMVFRLLEHHQIDISEIKKRHISREKKIKEIEEEAKADRAALLELIDKHF
jgi:hypothetical protein